MVLSQPDIRKAVKSGKIAFDPPLEESQWGECSVDLRLGRSFTTLKKIDGFKVSVASGLQGLGETGFWQTSELTEFDEFDKRKMLRLIVHSTNAAQNCLKFFGRYCSHFSCRTNSGLKPRF